jgi:hypothetical protein
VLAKVLGRDVEISTAVPAAPGPPKKTGRGKNSARVGAVSRD